MKFGDIVYYRYLHHFNRKSSAWRKKKAVFIKQEGDDVWIVCEGNKTVTKTTARKIKRQDNRIELTKKEAEWLFNYLIMADADGETLAGKIMGKIPLEEE